MKNCLNIFSKNFIILSLNKFKFFFINYRVTHDNTTRNVIVYIDK